MTKLLLKVGDPCYFYEFRNVYKMAYHLIIVINMDTDRECSIGFYPKNGIMWGCGCNQEACLRIPYPIFMCHDTFILKDSQNKPINEHLNEQQVAYLNAFLGEKYFTESFPCQHNRIDLFFPYSIISYNCVDFISELFPRIKMYFSRLRRLRRYSWNFMTIASMALIAHKIYKCTIRRKNV